MHLAWHNFGSTSTDFVKLYRMVYLVGQAEQEINTEAGTPLPSWGGARRGKRAAMAPGAPSVLCPVIRDFQNSKHRRG